MVPRPDSFVTMPDRPWVAPSVEGPAPEPEPALERNAFSFTVSREMALDYGLVEPTPEEATKRAADLDRYQREHAEEQAAAAATVRALDAITEPTSRAVLDLHQRAPVPGRAYVCEGCEADGYDHTSPAYPCGTTTLIASLHGLAFPRGLYELDRPEDGSLDPKETP